MVSFSENIYLWRIFRGLAQRELAGRAGIPRPNLSAIESGRRDVSLLTLRALAAALGVTPGVLINGIAPLDFKGSKLSRRSLEAIARISLGGVANFAGLREKNIGMMLSGIIRNRINAERKIYRNVLKRSKGHTADWLMLKAALETQVLNSLLARLDKYESKANR